MTDDTREALTELKDEIGLMLIENADDNDTHYEDMDADREQVLSHGRSLLLVMLAVGEDDA